MTPERQDRLDQFKAYRVRILPEQLARAYRRVEHLEREAIRLGMTDLLKSPQKHTTQREEEKKA